MSDLGDKFKRSKRLLKEENAIKKQSKILKSTLLLGENKDLKQPHRLAKKHARLNARKMEKSGALMTKVPIKASFPEES